MAQAFFHAGEDGLVVAGFEIDHPIGRETRLSDRWCEEIGARDAPEDLAFGAGRDARAEKRRSGSVDCAIAAAGDLMQSAESETAAG